MRETFTARECDECGEDLHPGRPCRTPEEILAECAPPAGYAAEERARRVAAFDRLDANRPGARPAGPASPARPAPTMPADVAAAIRALVLPAALVINSSPLDRCPCQYGACQRCTAGNHRGCTHARPINPPPPHTWITTAAGAVPNGRTCQVWTVGRPCQWVCPCPTCARPRPQLAEVHAPGNPPARRRTTVEALTLF